MMLLVHKDISHMPVTELENNSESVWVKVFANKTSHYVASWYRQNGDRNLHGGGMMLLVHKDISHMPITELANNSESVWVKVFAN